MQRQLLPVYLQIQFAVFQSWAPDTFLFLYPILGSSDTSTPVFDTDTPILDTPILPIFYKNTKNVIFMRKKAFFLMKMTFFVPFFSLFFVPIFFSVSDSIRLSKIEIWWPDIRSSDTFKVRYFYLFFLYPISIEYRKIDKSIGSAQLCCFLKYLHIKGIVLRIRDLVLFYPLDPESGPGINIPDLQCCEGIKFFIN
jgi:hypothetical protein